MSRVAAFLLVLLAGCGGPSPTASSARPAIVWRSGFPPRRDVEELARTEAAPLPRRDVATAAEWRVEQAPESTPIESRFAGVTFTKELRCVAREYGRLRAEKGTGQPDERLERFILGACGHHAPGVTTTSWKMDAPASTSDAAVLDSFRTVRFPDELKGKPAGAWVTRKNDQAILTIVSGTADAAASITLADASGHVTVQGTTHADLVAARINRWAYGTAPCERDESVKVPAYRFTCTLAPADSWAWVEVLGLHRSHRALVTSEALAIARRDPSAPLELASTEPGGADDDWARAIVDRVNGIRVHAKMAPLSLLAKQSTMNARLAPHFFRSAVEHDLVASDDVARGLLAGWDVEAGSILDGRFYGALLTGAHSPASWLDFALETPHGRIALLDPRAEQVAIGLAPSATVGGAGIAVTTYWFFESESRRAQEGAVLRRLERERAKRGLPPITLLPEMPLLEREIALVRAGKRNLRDVPDIVGMQEARRLRRSIIGMASVTGGLEEITFADAFLRPGPLAVRAAVTSYTPQGSPWGYYLVYLFGSVDDD